MESVIVTLIIGFANMGNLPKSGVLLPALLELMITFFLIIYSSDALGIMVSSIVKTPNTAMTVMPFVLIIQLVMSGMIFELKGLTEQIAKLTISKWSLNAIGITANLNAMENFEPAFLSDYAYTISNMVQMWLILILFTLIYGVISIISLRFVDRDKR